MAILETPGYDARPVRKRILATLAVSGLALIGSAGAAAGTFGKQDVAIAMDDGVRIAATLYTPDGAPPAAGWPAVMMLHGIGGRRDGPYAGTTMNGIGERFFASEGYAVLTFDARGHGASGGLFSADGPREMQDMRALFRWLAERPGIDGAHIGAFGVSLGGGAIWRAAIEGVPFAAIVPVIAWTDLYDALMPGGLAKSGAVLQFLQAVPAERIAPAVTAVRDDAISSRTTQALLGFARERSSRHSLSTLRVPTLILQGRRDFAFDIREASTAFAALRGPKRLYIGDLGHAPAANPPAEVEHYMAQTRAWFDRFLKGMPNGIDTRPPVEVAPDPWTGRTFQYRGLPPTKVLSASANGRSTIASADKVVRTLKLPQRMVETFGAPTVRVSASSSTAWPHLVTVLSAITPAGDEIVISQGGAKTTLSATAKTVSMRLISQATVVPRGSRYRLTIARSSTAQNSRNLLYLDTGAEPSARVTIGRVQLKLPILKKPISG
jgi:predicted acyl esterase